MEAFNEIAPERGAFGIFIMPWSDYCKFLSAECFFL